MRKEFLTAREVALVLGISVRTVWRWHAQDKLPPPFRVGRIIRWRARDLFAFLELDHSKMNPRKPA
ncbi:MAG TPA: helix-turn-helix domain-containing protein [Gemmataceae bacterium]|jgi:excisionase family DNA binding protein|nr:helix-turn-helix domain-containing protein [Gemmataceae bacterium]